MNTIHIDYEKQDIKQEKQSINDVLDISCEANQNFLTTDDLNQQDSKSFKYVEVKDEKSYVDERNNKNCIVKEDVHNRPISSKNLESKDIAESEVDVNIKCIQKNGTYINIRIKQEDTDDRFDEEQEERNRESIEPIFDRVKIEAKLEENQDDNCEDTNEIPRGDINFKVQDTEVEIKDDINEYDDDLKTLVLKCKMCSYITYKQKNLYHHMRKHSNHGKEQCVKNRSRCLLRKNPENSKIHQCSTCSFQSKYKQSIERHEVHCAKQCTLCPFSTQKKQTLIEHQLIVHKNVVCAKSYKCQYCQFSTRNISGLKAHNRIIHNAQGSLQNDRE